jgi:hypothetical protein
MIRWVVGKDPSSGTFVSKFPEENSVHSLDKIAQPAVVCREIRSKEVELEVGSDIPRFRQFQKRTSTQSQPKRSFEDEKWSIKDKEGKVRFNGQPGGVDSNCWFVIKQVLGKTGVKEYHLTRVDKWLSFTPSTSAQEAALDLESSEQLMKDRKQKEKTEFSEYLKQKRRKAEENGIALAETGDISDTDEKKQNMRRKKLVLKRLRGGDGDDNEFAESSVAFVGAARDVDGEWEGEEAFSDDDEKLFDDEVNANVELGIEVSDDDVEKDKVVPEDDDLEAQAETLFKDTFGSEVEKLIHNEQEKEHVAEEDLDDELKKFEGLSDEEEQQEETKEDTRTETAKKAPIRPEPQLILKKSTKEEQIRARIKAMFWRNEYKLKLRDVLSQFPGLNRNSEDYQFLTKALKDLADITDGVLHLKQQFRK